MTKLYYPPNGCPDIRYLRRMAKSKKMLWMHIELPPKLKDQCIAYCIREGGAYLIGRPSKKAIIFIFPDGNVYDISLLLHDSGCWRKISANSLKWIKENTP